MSSDLLIQAARSLTARRKASGKRAWDFLPAEPDYLAYLDLLRVTTDVAAFRHFLIEQRQLEEHYIGWPALKRIGELVQPDPYLYLRIHWIAQQTWNATVEEKYSYIDAAVRVGPDVPLVLWEQVLVEGAHYAETESVLHRLQALRPGDPLVARALASMTSPKYRHVTTEVLSLISHALPSILDFPGDLIHHRLRPKQPSQPPFEPPPPHPILRGVQAIQQGRPPDERCLFCRNKIAFDCTPKPNSAAPALIRMTCPCGKSSGTVTDLAWPLL